MTSFTKGGKKKADEDSKVQFVKGWIRPEPSFKEKDELFNQYKIVNLAHNKWKVYYENKDKKRGPPHLKKPPVDKGWEEIRENVDDIPWCELNKAEKSYVSSHESLEISLAKQLHQPVTVFIGRRGRGRFLSWNQYEDIRPAAPARTSKKSRGEKEFDPERPTKKCRTVSEDWF